MDCLDEDTIVGLLDGNLDAADLQRVEQHIDGCQDCRRVVSNLAGARTPPPGESSLPPDDLDAPGVGTVIGARFLLESVAGSGGMGRVYRARDLLTNERVAVKRVDVEHARFEREARLLAELVHPAIVRHVADGACEDGTRYLAMEWLDGEDLAHRLKRGPLSVEETLVLGSRIADALAAAHAHGVVHRDIKPSNLFLPGGSVEDAKVVDFGVARAPAASTMRTRSGALLGTPGYMAPEQARGESNIGPRADVFSLGCVLYECLTGERAFAGGNVMVLLANLLTAATPHPRARARHVPRALDALVVRMLSRDPLKRPADGSEVARELSLLGSWRALARPASLLRVVGGVTLGTVLFGGAALLHAKLRSPVVAPPAAPPVVVGAPGAGAITDFPASAATRADAAAEYAFGLQALRDAMLHRAKAHLVRAVELEPSLGAAHLRLSVWTDALMDAAESRAHFQAARAQENALSPRDQGFLNAMAPAFLEEPSNTAEVRKRLAALAKRYPGDAELALLAVSVQAGNRGPEYDEVLRLDPKFAYAWWYRANTEYGAYDDGAARASLDRCLEAVPTATLCVTLRLRSGAREGRCADMERDARSVLALENGPDYGYAHLANALSGQGADRAAIAAAVRARAAATKNTRMRDKTGAFDEAQLAASFGDFVEAERHARALKEIVKDETFVQEHVQWATLLVDISEERGDTAAAGKIADEFLRHRAGWRTLGHRPFDDPRPTLLAAAARAGLRSKDEVARERAAWLSEWETKHGDAGDIWTEGWARPARGPGDLAAAAAVMPDAGRTGAFRRGRTGWLKPMGFTAAYAGRVQLAADHPREAAATLDGVTRYCGVLDDAFSHTRASLWLGLAREATGDRAGACAAYAVVLKTWGHARPRSVTADEARNHVRALGCARDAGAP